MKVKITVHQSPSRAKAVGANLAMLRKQHVLVGVPESNKTRADKFREQASKLSPKSKRRAALLKQAQSKITNPQLVFLHTHGVRDTHARRVMGASMINRNINYNQALQLYLHRFGSVRMQIPARPIIEPAIEEPTNKDKIVQELRLAAVAALDGKMALMQRHLNLAGLMAQNIVREWFVDPRNNWAPNAPSTIRMKGSNRPLINFGEMRKAITYVVVSR